MVFRDGYRAKVCAIIARLYIVIRGFSDGVGAFSSLSFLTRGFIVILSLDCYCELVSELA